MTPRISKLMKIISAFAFMMILIFHCSYFQRSNDEEADQQVSTTAINEPEELETADGNQQQSEFGQPDETNNLMTDTATPSPAEPTDHIAIIIPTPTPVPTPIPTPVPTPTPTPRTPPAPTPDMPAPEGMTWYHEMVQLPDAFVPNLPIPREFREQVIENNPEGAANIQESVFVPVIPDISNGATIAKLDIIINIYLSTGNQEALEILLSVADDDNSPLRDYSYDALVNISNYDSIVRSRLEQIQNR